MKILVANGSPRGADGNTEVLVQQFIAGAQESGAEVEIIYLKDKKINHCIGCFSCWFKTPGTCIHKDDMPEILEKIQDADLLVYAMPLYVYTVPGLMKDFMDRVIPIVQPFIEVKNGISSHPSRNPQSKFRRMAIISSCGFPEMSHFNGLKETFKTFVRGNTDVISATICCPAGSVLKIPEMQPQIQWYLDAVKQAGKEVAQTGYASVDTQNILERTIVDDSELFAKMANAAMGNMLANSEKALEIKDPENENGILLSSPESLVSVRDYISGLAGDYDASVHQDIDTIVQIKVTDEEPGSYYLKIKDGRCDAYAGVYSLPTTTVSASSDVWLAVVKGELDGAIAFMTGKFKVAGDMAALIKLGDLLKK